MPVFLPLDVLLDALSSSGPGDVQANTVSGFVTAMSKLGECEAKCLLSGSFTPAAATAFIRRLTLLLLAPDLEGASDSTSRAP